MKIKIIATGLIATLLISSTGCKKFLDVNSDPDTPQEPSVSSVFPAMLAGIPRGVQYDSRYLGKYIQNWLTSSNGNNDTWDRHGYVFGSDVSGDIWRQTYYGLGKNLDYIIDKGKKTGQNDYVGAAYALKALMFQLATNYHGEIIFREAFKENTYYFKYDTQDVIYAGIDSLCRLAIQYLDVAASQPNTLALGDYTYKGDVSKWKKFTYGLLARNWNNLSN
ncbi:MAG TPA: SusD/RagB family nutrient-binding outer membrane lipoprotein, partial [Chitinophagaceae bacterium]